jgi:hypothetical protein
MNRRMEIEELGGCPKHQSRENKDWRKGRCFLSLSPGSDSVVIVEERGSIED